MTVGAPLTDALHGLVQGAYTNHAPDAEVRGGMLQGWVLVTEHVGSDGHRYLDVVAAPDSRLWTLAGYLAWAQTDVAAQIERDLTDEG